MASSFSQAGAGSAEGLSASTSNGIMRNLLKRQARTPKLESSPLIIRLDASDALVTSRRRAEAAPGKLDPCGRGHWLTRRRACPSQDRPEPEERAAGPGKSAARGLEELPAGTDGCR